MSRIGANPPGGSSGSQRINPESGPDELKGYTPCSTDTRCELMEALTGGSSQAR
jgi:hypothetical protein